MFDTDTSQDEQSPVSANTDMVNDNCEVASINITAETW